MRFIVAVDQNWAIGNKGGMLDHLPKDLAFFKAQTTGHVVFMGRKTLESFPQQKPLPNRTNIVLTGNAQYEAAEGVVLVHSEQELCEVLSKYASDDVYLIGGASMYAEMVDYCDEGFVTKIDHAYPEADSYFPNLDEKENWQFAEVIDETIDGDKAIRFIRYVNQTPKAWKEFDNE